MADTPTRTEVERALREIGLSNRQAKKMVRIAWPAVVGEGQAELDELRARIEEFTSALERSGAQ